MVEKFVWVLVHEYKSEWGNGAFEWHTEILSVHRTEDGMNKEKQRLKDAGFQMLRSYIAKEME